MRVCRNFLFWALLPMGSGFALASPALDTLLEQYRQQGADNPNASAGQTFFTQSFSPPGAKQSRRCTSCHGTNLRKPGKHIRTGKVIEPMAPSVNPTRLTDLRKINKWLYRNCKWTVGRECTAQEKTDLLIWLSQQ
jgi:hypothetical protein